jgi:propanol-preferring alcohol dehydrogenase
LCPYSLYTGWDGDGGYAGFTTVRADFAYRLPNGYSDAELAPLLCAGIIGYRALRLASVPPGGRLGIYGFGGSVHLTAQVAIAQGARVHVPASHHLQVSVDPYPMNRADVALAALAAGHVSGAAVLLP